MFAGGTCSVGSSTSTTVPRRDRIWVSDPHGLVVAALALVSAALAPMWQDYVVVLMNARGDRATLLWVVYEIPLLAIPLLIGWRGPRVQGSDRTVSASIEHPRTAPDELWRGLTG
jgi:hypothetical protein